VLNRPAPDPLLARTSWHVPGELDFNAMRIASDVLLGEHDFAAFCRRAPGTEAGAPIRRRVLDARWSRLAEPTGLLRFEIEAQAFCHQMVRSLVAALVALPSAGRGAGSSGHATIRLTAAEFLNKAASAVLSQAPPTPPGPNQFVYTETEEANGHKSQTWLSADGLREGRSGNTAIPTCAQYRKQMQQGSLIAPHFYCVAAMQAGYLPDLPTRPAAAMAYLIKIGVFSRADTGRIPESPAHWVANDVGKQMDSMLTSMYFLPAQRAALYELMAGIKGFRIVPHVSLFGHQGIGVAWTYYSSETTLVFSPRNYAYLGSAWATKVPTGKFYTGTEWLARLAVVNRAGQLP